MSKQTQILKILEKNARATIEEIAVLAGISYDEAAAIISEMEDRKIIFGYKALIDWDKTEEENVSAFIELKVRPQLGDGFDSVAKQIMYEYPNVKSISLMSGGFDLLVEIDGNNMKDVALFVAEPLSPMDCILSTTTHFVLRRYKKDGIILEDKSKDERRMTL